MGVGPLPPFSTAWHEANYAHLATPFGRVARSCVGSPPPAHPAPVNWRGPENVGLLPCDPSPARHPLHASGSRERGRALSPGPPLPGQPSGWLRVLGGGRKGGTPGAPGRPGAREGRS